jgi:hypothetical protein
MVTGKMSFDKQDEKHSESLYGSDWIPGVASSAQRIPYINLPVIEYNPDIEKNKDESIPLYTGKITGINPTSQINPYVNNTNFAVTAFNPDILQPSGDYPDPEADLKWYKNANDILYKEKQEFKLEIKVYKKIIKNLLKKK